jgi:hypothetical protein
MQLKWASGRQNSRRGADLSSTDRRKMKPGPCGAAKPSRRDVTRKLVVSVRLVSCMAVGPFIEAAYAQDGLLTREGPTRIAQAGFTFGSRDDLGPRYDPYSERWDQYKPSSTYVCGWVAKQTRLPDGRMALRRERLCGFKVPARD